MFFAQNAEQSWFMFAKNVSDRLKMSIRNIRFANYVKPKQKKNIENGKKRQNPWELRLLLLVLVLVLVSPTR